MAEVVAPDWSDPSWQDTPETKAILQYLRTLTPHFAAIPRELTDAEWTAFRALTKKGAVEGILFLSYTVGSGNLRETYYHVRGDYISAMDGEQRIRNDAPVKIDVVEARLTGTGEQWAEYLKGEKDDPIKHRALVLSLFWAAENQPGTVNVTTPRTSVATPAKHSSPVHQPIDPTDILESTHRKIAAGADRIEVLKEVSEIAKPLGETAATSQTYPANDSPPDSLPTTPISLADGLRLCAEAIKAYQINRSQLVRIYIELLGIDGGTWKGNCTRGNASGELLVKGTVIEATSDGRRVGRGIKTDLNPYGPLRNFKLVDPDGNPPTKDSPVFKIQQNMFFHTEEIRKSASTLFRLLPQLETIAPALGVDPTALTQVRHRLPPFPYIPVRAETTTMAATSGEMVTIEANLPTDFTPEDRKKAVANDEPFLAAALVTLEHLLQADWRANQAASLQGSRMGENKKESTTDLDPAEGGIGWLWNAILKGTKVLLVYRYAFGTAFALLIVTLARVLVQRWDWALFGVLFVAAMTVLWMLLEFARAKLKDHLLRPALAVVWTVAIAFIILIGVLTLVAAKYAFKMGQ